VSAVRGIQAIFGQNPKYLFVLNSTVQYEGIKIHKKRPAKNAG
jgi:hypothetical protein